MSAPAQLRRAKTSEAVADHLLGEFVAGRLRPGARIDLFEVADTLGISRAPVREALVLLERDGTVRMPLHRGAFLGDIDATTVREAFALYAVLSGLTARVAVTAGLDEVLPALESAAAQALSSRVGMEYEMHAREVRRLLNRAAGGTHLRALLRTFTGLVVAVSSAAIDADLEREQQLLNAELQAWRTGAADAAAEAAMTHVRDTGERGVAVLVSRGAVADDPPVEPAAARLDAIARMSEALAGEAR